MIITGLIDAITSRKWAMEAIILGVAIAAVWLGCHHLVQVGVQRERAAWVKKMADQQRANDVKSAHDQGVADAAHEADQKEIARLSAAAAADPLHGGLCNRPATPVQGKPAPGAVGGDAGAGAGGGDIRAVPPGDTQPGGQGPPDVRHLLDVLALHADGTSATLREYQARR